MVSTWVLASVGLAAEPELRGTAADLQKFLRPEPRTVTLIGHAKQTVQSDVGHVAIIVRTQAKDMTSAISANGQRRAAIAQALQSQGIDAKAIRAEKFSSSPQFGWFGKNPSSYEIVNRLTVDIVDERQLTTATAVGQPPEVTIGTITFEYSKQKDLEESARRAAFDDALGKKSFYEQRLGAVLRPVSFNYSDFSARGNPGSMMLEEVMVTASRKGGDSYAPELTIPSFDEKEYEVSVNVTFAVEAPTAGAAR
jgi:uncharacterized protein YggE